MPRAIVMSLINDDNESILLVLPLAHGSPSNPADAVEIPREFLAMNSGQPGQRRRLES
jgi:hypothetical protein